MNKYVATRREIPYEGCEYLCVPYYWEATILLLIFSWYFMGASPCDTFSAMFIVLMRETKMFGAVAESIDQHGDKKVWSSLSETHKKLD